METKQLKVETFGNGSYFSVNSYPNKVLQAKKRIDELSQSIFSAKEIRGLSKVEKEFISENNNRVEYVHNRQIYYLFIAKNMLGRKQLYAISKKQSISPNGNDVNKSAYNHQCWLVFDAKYNTFSIYNYEVRQYHQPTIHFIFYKN